MKIFLVVIFNFLFLSSLTAQQYEHLQIHNSVNDISYYRNLFSTNKVKKVTISYSDHTRIFSIDQDGKILEEEEVGDYSYTIVYNYENGNLKSYNGPYSHSLYEYDKNGNVKKVSDEEIEMFYFYDENNNLIRSEVGDQSIESVGIVSVNYKNGKVDEMIFDCMTEGDFYNYYKKIYNYDENKNLSKIISSLIGCFDKKIKDSTVIEYEYNEKGLPIREIITNGDGSQSVSIFTYEYYLEPKQQDLEEVKNEKNNLSNSFTLFGKDLKFNSMLSEFTKTFPEFKKYNSDNFKIWGSDLGGYETYFYLITNQSIVNEFDPFEEMYVTLAKFKNESLSELEILSGHSDEGYSFIDSLLSKFTLSKTEFDENLEIERKYFKKDNLEAEYYYYETAVLKISVNTPNETGVGSENDLSDSNLSITNIDIVDWEGKYKFVNNLYKNFDYSLIIYKNEIGVLEAKLTYSGPQTYQPIHARIEIEQNKILKLYFKKYTEHINVKIHKENDFLLSLEEIDDRLYVKWGSAAFSDTFPPEGYNIFTRIKKTSNTLRKTGVESVNDFSYLQFALINEEGVEVLRLGMPVIEVIQKIGVPNKKSKSVFWGTDELYHQTWSYTKSGIELDLAGESESDKEVDRITISKPCKLKTSQLIGIGSSKEDVINEYKDFIDKEFSIPGSIIIGSIYGGVIFEIQNEKVKSIFIGAGAE